MQNGSQYNISTPFAITRLNQHFASEEDNIEEEDDSDLYLNLSKKLDRYFTDGTCIVSKIPLKLFNESLIQHFNIKFQKNEIISSKRIKKPLI